MYHGIVGCVTFLSAAGHHNVGLTYSGYAISSMHVQQVAIEYCM